MNLPNKLTMLRILLITVFMVVLYWDFPGATWVAVAIFIVASFTDLLDGKIARKYKVNLVTDFGKFADPLADKMLVTAALLWFVAGKARQAGAHSTGRRQGDTADRSAGTASSRRPEEVRPVPGQQAAAGQGDQKESGSGDTARR